jgi:hypothetical protein
LDFFPCPGKPAAFLGARPRPEHGKFFPPSLLFKTPADGLKKFAFINPQAWAFI